MAPDMHPGELAGAYALHKQAPEQQKQQEQQGQQDYLLMHPVYSREELDSVQLTHRPPAGLSDKIALGALRLLRTSFDMATGYGHDMNERKYLLRFVFLETIAGVPGMIAGMLRHLNSLRTLRRDNGWIRTALEEAENERMHLMTFLELRKPGMFQRAIVFLAQGVFFNAYFLAYILSSKTAHRFVGYLEEEAVKTYTKCLKDLDEGKLPAWKDKAAPEIAKMYWRLPSDAKMRDLLLAVRADEACHRHVNHTLGDLPPNSPNPFTIGNASQLGNAQQQQQQQQ